MGFEIRSLTAADHPTFVLPSLAAFGMVPDPERIARAQRLTELDERFGAYDGADIVGAAGAYALTMTTPGAAVAVSGLTMVGVMPTHRRRGVMTQLVRAHLERARAEGRPISALWAAEPAIYGRFGYGAATYCGAFSIARAQAALRRPPARAGQLRLVGEAEARAACAAVWERVRPVTPGMMSRSDAWWTLRRLGDYQKGGPPLARVVLTIDGQPEGYALYRFANQFGPVGEMHGDLHVVEALGATPRATALVWQYLFEVDLARRIDGMLLPPDHPILHLARETRGLGMSVVDGLWLRLVDVEAALRARRWGAAEPVTVEVSDELCPWNAGRYRIDGDGGGKTDARADLRLAVDALGAAYLGSVALRRLHDAGEVEELTPGALERADRLFYSPRMAWCPEIF